MKKYGFLMVAFFVFLCSQAWAGPVMVQYVPAYNWYNGCGPTASGMIIGYWDLHGYDNLFDVSGWDAVKETGNVEEQLSSAAHDAKYNSTPDDPNLPAPADTSLADFFHTSEGDLPYGNSYLTYADDVFADYAAYRGYQFSAQSEYFSDLSWSEYMDEINAGRPMMLAVDTNQDGKLNHVVTAIGYEDRGADGLWYASYSTYSESENDVYWKPFKGLSSDWNWGIGYATFVNPITLASAYTLPGDTPTTSTPVNPPVTPLPDPIQLPDKIIPDNTAAATTPEPASVILLGCGLTLFAVLRNRKQA